jgi:hypothetical protein
MSDDNMSAETAPTADPQAPATAGGVADGNAPLGKPVSVVELPLGEALTLGESLHITRARRVQLVVIAGAVGAGKTTLMAALFHLFQKGSFAGYLFAGSETLLGFDRRCYLARTASGRSTPNTERTHPGEERQLLHLRVRRHDLQAPARDVLLSDLSGEDYREAKDSVEECKRLPLLKRADHFVLLIDASQLAQLDSRQRARNEATALLGTCLDAGQLGKFTFVDVLLSKWDLVNTGDSETVRFIEELEQLLKRQYARRVGRLRSMRVAARPGLGDSLGHGLDQVFPSWVEDHAVPVCQDGRLASPGDYTTEFDRYLKRRPRLHDTSHKS